MFVITKFFRKTLDKLCLFKEKIYILVILIFLLVFPNLVFAEIKYLKIEPNKINNLINEHVKEPFSYSGLASFYNNISVYIVNKHKIKKIDDNNLSILKHYDSLVFIGHHKILIISKINASFVFDNYKIFWSLDSFTDQNIDKISTNAKLLVKSDLNLLTEEFYQLKYVHLWEPLRSLCILIESIVIWINSLHNYGFAITIILLSLIFKLFTLPVNILLIRVQKQVSYIQASLSSELENIKSNYSGEEAHSRFIQAHKSIGVTPFYNLRPFLLTLFPIPFLISIFNVLGEMNILSGVSFLWIKDLAYPDAIYYINNKIPLIGNSLNLLPILMTLLTIMAAIYHKNEIISKKDLAKQRRNLYFMSVIFFFLFYSFPSAMVLFWVFHNIWQLIQQRFISV